MPVDEVFPAWRMKDDEHDCDDPIEELMVAAWPADGDWRAVIERLVAVYPQQARAIRRRYEAMVRTGMLGDETNDDVAERDARSLPGFTIQRRLGAGGMGVVFLAVQTVPLQRLVAIKVVKPGMDSASVLARFQAERQALARMQHPGIAAIHEAGATANGRPYFVMEYVDGPPIHHYCREHDLPLRDRIALMARVCAAVQHAHSRGVLHRDLKPSNILVADVDDVPSPKVIDFGLAKALHGKLADQSELTVHGGAVGTPAYMSPEQLESPGSVDERTDVFALGIVLFELLTEVLPPGPRADETPPLASRRGATGCGDLDWVVQRAIMFDRRQRYASAAALGGDLERWLRGEPTLARAPSFVDRLLRKMRRNRAAAAVAAAIAGALVVGWAMRGPTPPEAQTVRADQFDSAHKAVQAQLQATSAEPAAVDRLLSGRADCQRQLDQLRSEKGTPLLRFPTALVSCDRDGCDANHDSSGPQVSGNGRYVVFVSAADNLVPDDRNGVEDVFRKDLWTGEVLRVSVDASGHEVATASYRPTITADGRLVGFETASALPGVGEAGSDGGVFVRDCAAGTVRCVSAWGTGAALPEAHAAFLSADARCIAFVARPAGPLQVFARDLATGALELLSRASDGTPADGDCWAVSLSADGRCAVFLSSARNLDPRAPTTAVGVYWRDRSTGELRCLSRNADGTALDTPCADLRLSPDGRRVMFTSRAAELVAGCDGKTQHVFVADVDRHTIQCVSVDRSGTPLRRGDSTSGSFDASGDRVCFTSASADLEPGDQNKDSDVFVRDLAVGSTLRAVHGVARFDPAGGCSQARLADDGRTLVCLSAATNLLYALPQQRTRAFAFDLAPPQSGAITRIAAGLNGAGIVMNADGRVFAWVEEDTTTRLRVRTGGVERTVLERPREAGRITAVQLSDDGTRLAFTSTIADLVAGDENNRADAFVLDLRNGTMRMAKQPADATESSAASGAARISGDGRYVIYRLDELDGASGGDAMLVRRDLGTGETKVLSKGLLLPAGPDALLWFDRFPSVSADGGRVVFCASVSPGKPETAWLWDATAGVRNLWKDPENVDMPGGCSLALVSSDGRLVAFAAIEPGPRGGVAKVYVHDVATARTACLPLLAGVAPRGHWLPKGWSADGRYLLLQSRDDVLVRGNDQLVSDLYRHDLTTGELVRLVAEGTSWRANLDTYDPSVSADGRAILLRTHATNFVANDANSSLSDGFLIDVDRLRAANATLATPERAWAFADAPARHRHQSLRRLLDELDALERDKRR